MKSRVFESVVILGILVLVGWMTRPISSRASVNDLAIAEVSAMDASIDHLGQGVSFAILGGYRSLVANMVWLSLNSDWENRDFVATMAKIRLTTSIDPRPKSFWLNGARIIASDMPVWAIGDWNAVQLFETEEGAAIRRRFARMALDFLKDARLAHPDNPDMVIEQAIIHWRKLEDLETAAELFGEVVGMDAAPFFAGRIYAELLERLGRLEEALFYLESIVDQLPAEDPRSMKPVVESRIRKLKTAIVERREL